MTIAKSWMIYGANGYTGELIAREAKQRGLTPILAGRSPRVSELARELGFEARTFGLNDGSAARQLQGVQAVLHCAGPFSATSRPMLDACIRAKVHYLDITGEIDVFESIFARDQELKKAGIVALPGSGFDVVPTDCLAAMLKNELPDASHLILAFRSDGSLSPGTAKSMIEGLALGGRVRQDGRIVHVPIADRALEIVFKNRPQHAILAPWGDVSTAYYSTAIPNIECYIAGARGSEHLMRLAARLTRFSIFNAAAKRIAHRLVSGATEKQRTHGRTWIWGEVSNAAGKSLQGRLEVPEGYQFTIDSSLACVARVIAGDVQAGSWTPSRAFGAEFVLSLKDVVHHI